MRRYVCTFAFSLDRTRLLLIRKARPAWQAGKLNGIGGKVEPGETLAHAARRELLEESGLDWPIDRFEHVLTLSGTDDDGSGVGWEGHFFRAFGQIDAASTLTDEVVIEVPSSPVPPDTIPNLRWIIPLMLDDQAVRAVYRAVIAPDARG